MMQKHRRVRVGTPRDHSPAQSAVTRTTERAQQGAVAALQKEAWQEGVEDSQNPRILETKSGGVATAAVSPL